MGVLALRYTTPLAGHDLLFLEKYANRVGYCLHNKILADRNARHILFLRKLSHDIGHNIITPNMRLKLLLNHLENQINELGKAAGEGEDPVPVETLRGIQGKMAEHIKDIQGTFNNSALFLESLLRQSHFDVGHYVLRRVRLDIREAVVTPQFERYRGNLLERGLCVPETPDFPSEPCLVEADFGLISQVLANFFSNAVKYACRQCDGRPGEVRCKVEVVPAAFKGDQAGIKVSVFSSGPPIPKEEAGQLFDDNYRATNSHGKSGTGHGLFFVREILAAHGGSSGYEALPGGNSFYFILPKVE
jgi:signal transduction histidine kinase